MTWSTGAGGDSKHWLILRNGTVTIGLFQGMFERNILTFNPGWDETCQTVQGFTDVREHQRRLKAQGLELQTQADETRFWSISTCSEPRGDAA